MNTRFSLATAIVLMVTIGSFLLVNTYPKGLITSNYKSAPAATQYVEPSEINDVKYAVEMHTNFEQIISTVEESEYHIKQFDDKLMVSPNRAQDMRITYAPDRFSINQRNKAENEWDVQMQIAGVFRDNQQVYAVNENAPQITNANHLEYDHGNWVVQYINDRHGMRQNFIVNEKPKGATPLAIKMQVQSSTMQLECSENALKGYINNELQYTYSDLKVWDAEGTILAANMTYEDGLLNIEVADVNAQYPITIDPVSESFSMTYNETQVGAELGCAVSGAGDLNADGYDDVIVGAHLYDNGSTDEGVVFVFYGNAYGLYHIPFDTLEIDQAGSDFGIAISNAGDVNGDGYDDVIIGASSYDNGQTNEGGAFIYYGTADGINTTPAVILEGNQNSASFGTAVSGAGDINGDGYDDVVVGASLYDNGQTNEGRVFIFHGSPSGISTTPAATMENNQSTSYLGSTVSTAGDINGDGYDDIIAGAPNFDNDQTDEGRVFVYHGTAAGINTTPVATLESTQAGAFFGKALSNAGDVNGDGFADVIVGAPYFDGGDTNEGRVYIYHGSASGIITVANVVLSNIEQNAYFGIALSDAGDFDNDGYDDIIVGASKDDNDQVDEGMVYTYHGASDGIYFLPGEFFESNQAYAKFGSSVCNAGDVDGDGRNELMIGAPFYGNGGSVFLYFNSNVNLTSIFITGYDDYDFLGSSVAPLGDINGDGNDDVIVGARNYETDGNTGAAFIYFGSGTDIVDTPATIILSVENTTDFGDQVSAAGDVNGDGYMDVLVSAYNDAIVPFLEAVYVFHGTATGIETTPAVVLEAESIETLFGSTISAAGDLNGDGYDDIVIGEPEYYWFGYFEWDGRANVYYGSPSGLSSEPSVILEINDPGSEFGSAVSGAGDVNGDGYDDLVVGAKSHDTPTTNTGGIFIYYGSPTGIATTPDVICSGDHIGIFFGWSVADAGDVNGDGFDDIVAGAPFYPYYQGATYIFYGSASGINPEMPQIVKLNIPNARMGESVSTAGDVNADGYDDIIVGGTSYNSSKGAAWIHLGGPLGVDTIPYQLITDDQPGTNLGISVATAGDVNNDGFADVIVGAPSYDYIFTSNDDYIYGSYAGAAFVVPGATTNWCHVDNDGDGFGDANGDSIATFNPPTGYVFNALDCNDSNNNIFPGAPEYCNGIDEDCDGVLDNGLIPEVEIAAGGPTTFCSGGNVTLTATHTGTSVQWKKNGVTIAGATSDVYTAYLNGNYTCEVTGDCGITVSTPILVTVNKNPTASITAGGPTSFCAGGSVVLTANAGAGLSYQWFKGGAAITGATSISYTATTAGNYKCQVTKTATGCGKNSNKIGVEIICREGENVESLSSLTLYPNPATTVLYVVAQLENGPIQILNDLGQLIIEITPESETTAINIEDLPKGIYLVRYGSSVGSIVKQ